MDENKNETEQEDQDCKPLTDEEFKAFQEKEKRTEKKMGWIFSAIETFIDFFT